MLRVGIVGIGFMGMIHYLAWQRVSGAKVSAIATRDPKKRAGDWTGIKGNFGPPGKQEDLSGIETSEAVHTTAPGPQRQAPSHEARDRARRRNSTAMAARISEGRYTPGRSSHQWSDASSPLNVSRT